MLAISACSNSSDNLAQTPYEQNYETATVEQLLTPAPVQTPAPVVVQTPTPEITQTPAPTPVQTPAPPVAVQTPTPIEPTIHQANNEAELRGFVNLAASNRMPMIIQLANDIEMLATLEMPSGSIVSLSSYGDNLFELSSDSVVIRIENGATFTLDGITVTRKSGAGSTISNRGTFTMLNGNITAHPRSPSRGISQGVDNSGTFIMKGGYIRDHIGSGVSNVPGQGSARFYMYGGIISNNGSSAGGTSVQGGGVNNGERFTFTMRGGVISYNGAASGGGVFNSGTFYLYDGVISGNRGRVAGGGVNNPGIFVMNGGTISNNSQMGTYSGTSGGGVTSSGSEARFTLRDGEIVNNTAIARGGGVAINAGHFIMQGGRISENSASESGGGIVLSLHTMHPHNVDLISGEISSNVARNGGGIGIAHNVLVNHDINFVVGANVIFSDNRATNGAFNRLTGRPGGSTMDDLAHDQRIFTTHFTLPFTQGFNNMDISYTEGTRTVIHELTFNLRGTNDNPVSPIEISPIPVIVDDNILNARGFPPNPTRTGYTFGGWYILYPTLPLNISPIMPSHDLTIYARWN